MAGSRKALKIMIVSVGFFLSFSTSPLAFSGLDLHQFSQPKHLWVADLRGANLETKVLLASLQGIVNREEPRIFLLASERNVSGEVICYENLWLTYYQKEKGIDYTLIEDPFSLLEMFKDELSGYVIYDPELPESYTVAAMKASLSNSLVAHPKHIELLENLGYNAVEDLRGKWKSKVEMVEYSINEYWPKMKHTILMNENYNSESILLLDYLIASKAFLFCLNPAIQDEREMIPGVYSKAPKHSILFAWPAHEERRTVVEASKYNLLVLCSGGPNLSVHAGVDAPNNFKEFKRPKRRVSVENKVYIVFAYSEGDASWWWIEHFRFWPSKRRGEIPVALTTQPLLVDIAPAMMEYYWKTATDKDSFYAGPSGAGYVYISLLENREAFAKFSKEYFERSGIEATELWFVFDPDQAVKFAEETGVTPILGPWGPVLSSQEFIDGTLVIRRGILSNYLGDKGRSLSSHI